MLALFVGAAASSPARAAADEVSRASAAPATFALAQGDSAAEAPAFDAPAPRSLSPWGMFLSASLVVKTAMLVLAAASVAAWTVWLVKSVELNAARAAGVEALRSILSSRTLDEAVSALRGRGDPGALCVRAAAEGVDLSRPTLDIVRSDGLKERVASRLARVEAAAVRRISRGAGILATIGSTAPFVGLFGAVWGIMNAFIGISEARTTNLTVVAPGIAEALLVTAFGLAAAIPAVVIYNAFARSIAGYRQLLADASAAVERLVSRDLDFRAVERGAP